MKWERPQKGKDRARENSRKQKPEVMPNTIAHPLTTNPTSPQTAHSLLFPVSTLSLMFYGIPLTTSAALVILPHSFLCPCLLAVHGKWRTPWFMGNNKKHWCAINIILTLNPKQSTILTSRTKINSIQAKSRPVPNNICVYEKAFL